MLVTLIRLWIFCLSITASSLFGTDDPVTVYLTWQRSPETTMLVQWLTPFDRQDDSVEYKREGDAAWLKKRRPCTHA